MTERDDDPDLRLPPALQRDLRRLFAARVRVPAALDEALAAAARRRRIRPLWQRPLVVSAAAAALLAVSALVVALQDAATPTAQLAREDFDGDGRVDVLDAYRLALALRRGDAVSQRFDLDGDGAVSERDADRIAAHAVRIHG